MIEKRELVKGFIEDHPAIKKSVLCELIGWDQSSFSQWMSGTRGIPRDKLTKLALELEFYGFKND